MDRKYLVYKITNRFDGKIYIGCHSTLNKNDRYMGSGTEIKEALKKYGRKSFVKEILFEYDTKEEMLAKEKEFVTKEFCMRDDTYNRIEGGGTYLSVDMVTVKDKEGNTSKVYLDDPRWLSGELVHVTKGTVTVKDKDGKFFRVSFDDERLKNGELKMSGDGLIAVKDKFGNVFSTRKDDDRYLSGELISCNKGNPQHVNVSWKGKKHRQESKDAIGKANSLIQSGSGNSQFGKKRTDNFKKDIKKKLSYEFFVYDNEGNFISKEFGINDYARKNNVKASGIINTLKGKYKTSNGLKFFYEFKGEKI